MNKTKFIVTVEYEVTSNNEQSLKDARKYIEKELPKDLSSFGKNSYYRVKRGKVIDVKHFAALTGAATETEKNSGA